MSTSGPGDQITIRLENRCLKIPFAVWAGNMFVSGSSSEGVRVRVHTGAAAIPAPLFRLSILIARTYANDIHWNLVRYLHAIVEMRGTRGAGCINHFQATGREDIRASMNFIRIRVRVG